MNKSYERIERIEYLKHKANHAKDELIFIADRLYEEGATGEAKSLETIIGKLEAWQNK